MSKLQWHRKNTNIWREASDMQQNNKLWIVCGLLGLL